MSHCRITKALVVLSIVAAQIAGVLGLAGGNAGPAAFAQQRPTEVTVLARELIPESATDADLQSQIEEYLANTDGRYGVAVRNLDDGRVARVNAQQRFEAASMYKLLIMHRVFERIESGELKMDDVVTIQDGDTIESALSDFAVGETVTVEQAVNAMITVSSNSAAHALSRTVGGWEVVTTAAESLGMEDTRREGTFVSTPDDLMHFFVMLADRKIVSREASNRMVELLLDQKVNDRIPALLPKGVQVAHKTGELEDVRNDGGIVSSRGGRFVIVVMSDSVDPPVAEQVIAEISRMVFERYG